MTELTAEQRKGLRAELDNIRLTNAMGRTAEELARMTARCRELEQLLGESHTISPSLFRDLFGFDLY